MFEKWFKKKENPAQATIVRQEGESHYSNIRIDKISSAYDKLEVVNRGVNLLVDTAADINIDVKERLHGLAIASADIRPAKIDTLLNYKPNPYQDINSFKRNILLDLVLEGNAFLYFDGQYLYNLPADKVEIVADKITYIKKYVYVDTDFLPNEIIHIKDNSATSIYRGSSRLQSALDTINALSSLIQYQQKFLDNGTIPGIVLTSENPLSDKVKERVKRQWRTQYSVKDNARSPILLDAGWKLNFLGASTIKELDFEASVETLENKILEALGVPQILLRSGNNANVSPNIRMFYHTTVIPLLNKVVYALERYFGYDLKIIEAEILPMRPDLREEGAYWTSMVNAGILTRNEAREQLRYEKLTDDIADRLILPANIAGSAQDASVGGRPPNAEN